MKNYKKKNNFKLSFLVMRSNHIVVKTAMEGSKNAFKNLDE